MASITCVLCPNLNISFCSSNPFLLQLKSKTNGASETLTLAPSTSSQSSDVQKKITPWSNPKTVVNELFPESLSTLSGMQEKDINSEMILVTTLLSKLPNIGGWFTSVQYVNPLLNVLTGLICVV